MADVQYDFGNIDESNTSGTDLGLLLETWRDALNANHRGASRPSYVVQGMFWIKETSPLELYFFDGSQDILFATMNPTTHKITLYHNGSALGSIVNKVIGIASGEVPTADLLGAAAFKAIGTSSGQIPTADLLGALAYLAVGQGVETSGGTLRVKLEDATLARGTNGIKLNSNAVDLAHLVHQTADTILGMLADGTPGIISAGDNITIDNGIISAGGGGRIFRVYSASATWTKPTGLSAIRVWVTGGGGAAGGAFNAGSGGTSSFGAHCSATGGQGGRWSSPNYAVGGVGVGGDINIYGQYTKDENGGASFWGHGTLNLNNTPRTPTTYGEGASTAVNFFGGAGGGTSIKLIDEASLTATEVVTVGPAGSGGGSGATAGAPGVVMLEEFY